MPAKATARQGQIQQLGTTSRYPTWMAETQLLEPLPTISEGAI